MLTDEAHAALATMSEGCLRELDALGSTVYGAVMWERPAKRNPFGLQPVFVPLDPTAIVAEAARMDAGEVHCGVIKTTDGLWKAFLRSIWDESSCSVSTDPLTAALLLFAAAYERAHGGG